MLTATFRYFLDDLNLMNRQRIYSEQDGHPDHNVCQVDIVLQDFFHDNILGNNGSIRTAPRSPDITHILRMVGLLPGVLEAITEVHINAWSKSNFEHLI